MLTMTYNYTASCQEAKDRVDAILEDDFGASQSAPLEEIAEEYMKEHIMGCPKCFKATVEASL